MNDQTLVTPAEDALARADWRTATYSTSGGNCVEIAATGSSVAVRDTKNRSGGVQQYTPSAWAAFLTGIRSGSFDLS